MASIGLHRFFARSLRYVKIAGCVSLLLCLWLSVSPASGETILANFEDQPISADAYELIWSQGELCAGPGAIGTGFDVAGPGDGESPISDQSAPGLSVQAPFNISDIPGSVVMSNGSSPSTLFYDATLMIHSLDGNSSHGLPAAGDAVITSLDEGLSIISQPLGGGQFSLWSTDPVDESGDDENPVLLLNGTIDDAVITGILGSTAGSVLSAHVTYTDGAIYDAACGQTMHGELSWSLANLSQAFAVDSTTNQLVSFEANAVGQFKYCSTPEPGSVALLLFAGLTLLGYAPRKRRG